MSTKHKEHILAILKHSGPLPGSTLKERVLNDLQIEEKDYPKSSFHRHIEQLVNEARINFKIYDNKRTYFIEEFQHPIQGGLLIDNLGGSIYAPNILLPFDIMVDRGQKEIRDKRKFHLFFEFNSTNICLSIHKDAIPFNFHISRRKDKDVAETIITQFGLRTIVLELPVSTISSFKPQSLTGHILVNFSGEKTIKAKDLDATNSAEVIEITGLSLETFSNEISIISSATVRNDVNQRSKSITGRTKFEKGEEKTLTLPTMLQLSLDSSLVIF